MKRLIFLKGKVNGNLIEGAIFCVKIIVYYFIRLIITLNFDDPHHRLYPRCFSLLPDALLNSRIRLYQPQRYGVLDRWGKGTRVDAWRWWAAQVQVRPVLSSS
jgi:hypothetical protein